MATYVVKAKDKDGNDCGSHITGPTSSENAVRHFLANNPGCTLVSVEPDDSESKKDPPLNKAGVYELPADKTGE